MQYLINFYNYIKCKLWAPNASTVNDNIVNSLDDLLPNKEETNVRLPYVRIVSNYNPNKPSVVIVDDSQLIVLMVQELLNKCGVNKDTHNILKFYGVYAPFVLRETLLQLKDNGLEKIDLAVIDIVLPGKIKEDNIYVKMDGIDVSTILSEKYHCDRFLFFSGNVLNVYVDYIQEKVDKFKDFFNDDLHNYIVVKTQDEDTIIDDFKRLLSL